ncbi:MAG: hypothetical protein SVR04_02270 [Spirochaetota bacterium]|nr:hypothetical protein [Spirochaetota bacterium]
MVKITPLILIIILIIFGCIKTESPKPSHAVDSSSIPEMKFLKVLEKIETDKDYSYDFQKFIAYEMQREETIALNEFVSCNSGGYGDDRFSWYIRTFTVDTLGVTVLIEIVRSNEKRIEKILDIATFRKEEKKVYFGTLWTPNPYQKDSQEEDPYRLGVFFYEDPHEVKSGTRIYPDYIIDMKDRELYVHEPSGEDEKLFLYRDPNPV